MPTKKKRVGFIPREDVMNIIDKLSQENNLSNSKIISILVEEALSLRGIFNKKTGKESYSSQPKNQSLRHLSKKNENFTINNVSANNNTDKSNLIKDVNQEDLELQTFKKFLLFLKFQEMMDENHP